MERPLFADLAAALGLYFVWLLGQQAYVMLNIPPLIAAGLLLVVGLIFAAWFLLPGASPAQAERRERSLVRPLAGYIGWSLVAALGVAVALTVFIGIYGRLVPSPDLPTDQVDAYMKRPYSWLPFFVGFVAIDALVSEVIFRGWVQQRLTKAFGPEVAMANAAALSAVATLLPPLVPVLFLLGLACGFSVYLTRSVWSAVLIHIAFKATWFAADAWIPEFDGPSGPFGDARGIATGVGLMVIAGAVAAFAFHKQRIRHDADAEAESRAPSAEARSSLPR